MAQFARPDSDVTVNTWITTPLWQKIDETPADDGDFIASDNNTNDLCEIGLSDVSAPDAGTQTVRYRYDKDSALGHVINLTVRLVEGVTIRGSQTHNDIPGDLGVQAGSFTVTGIVDYTNLRVQFERGGDTGGNVALRRRAQVQWVEFEVPDAAAESHSGSGVVSGGGTITGSATTGRSGVGLLSGGGTLSSTSTTGRAGSGTSPGGGTLAASVTTGRLDTGTIAGGGTLSASGISERLGTGTTAGGGALLAVATAARAGVALLGGGGTITASGTADDGSEPSEGFMSPLVYYLRRRR